MITGIKLIIIMYIIILILMIITIIIITLIHDYSITDRLSHNIPLQLIN